MAISRITVVVAIFRRVGADQGYNRPHAGQKRSWRRRARRIGAVGRNRLKQPGGQSRARPRCLRGPGKVVRIVSVYIRFYDLRCFPVGQLKWCGCCHRLTTTHERWAYLTAKNSLEFREIKRQIRSRYPPLSLFGRGNKIVLTHDIGRPVEYPTSSAANAFQPATALNQLSGKRHALNTFFHDMLKNYTSGVPTSKTISRIEEVIAGAGATGVLKDYEGGRLIALRFRIVMPNGQPATIRLPANSEAVFKVMMSKVRRPRASTEGKIMEQAERTAWKLMQDWVEVQISLIDMQQAEISEVFMPFLWDGKQTFFTAWKENRFKELPETCGS